MTISPFSRRVLLLLTLVLALTPYFVNLGASSLWDSNESFYAETPREMIESGDYLSPSFNYKLRLNKPPLCYWIVAASYRLIGVSEQAERIPIAIAAMVLIWTAFALGRLILSTEAGLLSAVALAASPRFLFFCRRIIIDVYLAMFMTLALVFFSLAESRPSRRRFFLALMYASIGLGTMTKGPVAALLCVSVFLIHIGTERGWRRVLDIDLLRGTTISAALVLPWYAAVYRRHGWAEIASFLSGDNLSRFAQGGWGPRRSVFFYAGVLLGDLFPWSVFLITAIGSALIARYRRQAMRLEGGPSSSSPPAGYRGFDRQHLVGLWIAVIVIFFTLSKSKEDLYILPVYPAVASLVGAVLARFLEGKTARTDRLLPSTFVTIGLVMSGAGTAILYWNSMTPSASRLAGVGHIGCIALLGGIVIAAAGVLRRQCLSVVAVAWTVIAVNWVIVLKSIPDYERFKPARAMADILKAKASPDATIATYGLSSPSLVFYLRRPIVEFADDEKDRLKAALSSNAEVFCLTTKSEYESFKSSISVPTYVLASRPLYKVKLRGILERSDAPQAVLISNRSG